MQPISTSLFERNSSAESLIYAAVVAMSRARAINSEASQQFRRLQIAHVENVARMAYDGPQRASRTVPGADADADASRRASRTGLGLAEIVRWRASCPAGDVRDKLSNIARTLADAVNGRIMPGGASALIRSLPKSHEGCGTFPWNGDDLEGLSRVLGSAHSPANLGIDQSTLGARSLAGMVIAHLWVESVLQCAEGPTNRYSARPLPLGMAAEPGTLSKQATAAALQACIGALATCDSVADIKNCLNDALEPLEHMELLPGKDLSYNGRLRSALKMVEAEEDNVSVVGKELMQPPFRGQLASPSNAGSLAATPQAVVNLQAVCNLLRRVNNSMLG